SAFIRGGAASIYGDYLLGEYSRHGLQLLDSLAGPVLGHTNKAVELYNDLKKDAFGNHRGSATAALATRIARDNTPFANMIYTRAAVADPLWLPNASFFRSLKSSTALFV